jgi:hypothetical protein
VASVDHDFSEYLISEAQSSNSAFHQFRLLYTTDGEEIHAFYEGEDDPLFYTPIIRPRLNGKILHTYICDGKWKVDEVHSFIVEAGYPRDNCLFFVDRDYDDLFDCQVEMGDDAYLTEVYSIENHLVCDGALEVVLQDFVGLCALDPERGKVLSSVARARREFLGELRKLTAWALAQRERGNRPNFNNVELKHVFSVAADGAVARKPNGFARFKLACCGHAPSPPLADIRRWLTVIDGLSEKEWARGKFELWLFGSALIASVEDAVAEAKARAKPRVRVPASLKQRRLFDMLGGRLPPPPTLECYLGARLQEAA